MKRLLIIFALCLLALSFGTLAFAEEGAAVQPWYVENMLAIGAILVAAISEIIGMSPLKSNSIVQLVLNLLTKLTGSKEAKL